MYLPHLCSSVFHRFGEIGFIVCSDRSSGRLLFSQSDSFFSAVPGLLHLADGFASSLVHEPREEQPADKGPQAVEPEVEVHAEGFVHRRVHLERDEAIECSDGFSDARSQTSGTGPEHLRLESLQERS